VTRFAPFLFLAAVASALAATAPGALAASKATYYVSVGDSLAQGYQPIGGPLSPLGIDGYAQGTPISCSRRYGTASRSFSS
jgi:hypothetical protein